MRRIFVVLFALTLLASPVSAQDEFQFLKPDPGAFVPVEAPAGWTAESMPMDPATAAQIRENRQHRKSVQIMATYVKLGQPALGNGIDSHDVLPLTGSSSNWHGIVIGNLGGARYVNIKVKATGATPRQNLVGNGMLLPANSVTIIRGQWNPFRTGMCWRELSSCCE